MAQIALYTAKPGGTAVVLGAAASGDTALTGDNVTLLIQNADSSSHTLTIAVPGNLETGDAYPDKVITIAAGAYVIEPMLSLYRDPTAGVAVLTWSATTSMTRALIRR